MKQYKISLTARAKKDIANIYDYIYIKLQSPINAIKQREHIIDMIDRLRILPKRYQIIDSEENLRRMPVDKFSVFYKIEKDLVIITNVLYSPANLEKQLNVAYKGE